ncbi:RNA-binding domain-containing protein [Athelia psychrophila]|uniref:RNA-binding domain-containing protein n=1 Tax=Athelia psychrophila TaxID=1759441 RepID=A0A166I1N4_9AGAM|nr:RNA-binding domain-containing protein [Fibularhizoctonia sp. CBS 109695]
MEEGTRTKKTVFIGGVAEEVDESTIYEHFSTFGDIIEVQLPSATTDPNRQAEAKHRGFAFVTYGSAADAQDAIDNMDMNEMSGKVLKVNLARPMKGQLQAGGNRAVWESEEWLQQYAKPLAQSGGVQGRGAKDPGENDDQDETMEEA